MLTSIVATLGAGMKGYAEGKRQYDDDEFRKEQQDRQRKAWKDEDDLKAGLKDAAKPVEAVSGQIGDVGGEDEEGNPLAPNPTVGTGKVGTTRYATMAEAQNVAQEQNTPEAQATRMADAYAKAGRPVEALQLRAGAKQGRLADLQLEKAERDALDERYARELDELATTHGGFIKGVAAYLTKTQMGGAEGKTFVARPSADGKQMQIVAVNPDGSEFVYKSYDNDEKGDVQARVEAMKADAKTKTLFLFDLNKQRTADEQAKARLLAEERRTRAQEDAAAAANKNADTNARKLDLMFQRMNQPSQGGQAPQGGVVSIEDQRKFNGDFAALLPDPKQATDAKESAAVQAANNTRLAQAQAVFQANVSVGRVLTAPEVMQAQELAKDPKMVQVVGYKDQSGAITPVEVVMVNGKPVVVGKAKLDQTPPALAPAPAPAPAPSMAQATRPAENFQVTAPDGSDLPSMLQSVATGDASPPRTRRPNIATNRVTSPFPVN